MKILYGIIFLFMFVPIHLFAAYPGTTQNVGVLVLRNHDNGNLEPNTFTISYNRNDIWYNNPTLVKRGGIFGHTGCPILSPVGLCRKKFTVLGAVSVDWEPYLFLQEANGNVWINKKDDGEDTWTWKDVGGPGNIRGVGATAMRDHLNKPQRPYLFATNEKGKIYNLWRDENKVWHWADLGCPGGKCDKDLKGVGTIRMYDSTSTTERPWLFVFDDNEKKLWLLFWNTAANPQQWSWSDLGCPANNCDKKKKYIGIGAISKTRWENAFDVGEPRYPYVFLAEQDNPNKIHYIRLAGNRLTGNEWRWRVVKQTNMAQVIGVVSVYDNDDIIPVIVSESKDQLIYVAYQDKPEKWIIKPYKCELCPHDNAIAISRTHTKEGGRGVIVYEVSKDQRKKKFNTYRF